MSRWYRSPEYRSWEAMRARCERPTDHKYPDYGARGIRVCERWSASFESFLADVGLKPSRSHTIDRIDNDGHYEPGNVRWATPKEQARNRRSSRLITLADQTRTLAEWSEVTGLKRETIQRRLGTYGWSTERALSAGVDEDGTHAKKLAPDDVRAIRRLAAVGTSRRQIATSFGIDPSTVSHIVTGKTWPHISEAS